MPNSRGALSDLGDGAPSDEAWINHQFYENAPWETIDRRLMLLALLFRRGRDVRAMLEESVTIGPVTLRLEPVGEQADAEQDELRFVAVEAHALLHHASETVLRLMHAHRRLPDGSLPGSPALELSSMRQPGKFKAWVEDQVLSCASRDDRESLVADLFGPGDGVRTAAICEHLEILSRHFLDSAPYNAVKHGLAATGEHSRLELKLSEDLVHAAEGPAISWIDLREERPRVTTRWYRLESALLLSDTAARLIEQIWQVGQHRYVGGAAPDTFTPRAAEALRSAFGSVGLFELETRRVRENIKVRFTIPANENGEAPCQPNDPDAPVTDGPAS